MSNAFAAYIRTSTDDNQSPEDSKRWQLALAEQLIAPKQGHIVAIYHDIDTSRSLPWSRRTRAKELLDDLVNPHRGWDNLVIGEPQRAFSGAQFQLVFPVLCHYKVQLWVPEVGGPIDPDSEAHDLVMSLFGGLSKAERRRVQHRTRASMLALATDGRWLGGRTNYGYRLVDTDKPHPNKRKAAAGIRLRTLEPDPETRHIVQRIFTLYDHGKGYRAIARELESEGIPSPGEIGSTRHPRSAGVWSGSAVRAILLNPRYLGHQVAGRLRRNDELLDPTDPALGTNSRMHLQSSDTWSWSEEQAWPALIDEALYRRVNARIVNRPNNSSQRIPRSTAGKYLLAGLIRCDHCGKSMFGYTAKGKPYYKCESNRPGYATPNVPGHPKTYSIREERILLALDNWLTRLTDTDRIEETVTKVLAEANESRTEPVEVAQARESIERLKTEQSRILAAIRAGMDLDLAVPQTKQIQTSIASAQAVIDTWERSSPKRPGTLTEEAIRARIGTHGTMVSLLTTSDRCDRAELYRNLNLTLRYHRTTETGRETILARSQLTCSGDRI